MYVAEELENPHLTSFYEHLHKNPNGHNPFALDLQLYFLNKRFENEKDFSFAKNLMILDRCVLEYYEIFVRNLFQAGYMSVDDFRTYQQHYKEVSARLAKPNIMIFLKSSLETALERIRLRDREYEKTNLDIGYLAGLQSNYDRFNKLVRDSHTSVHVIEIDTDDRTDEQVAKVAFDHYLEYMMSHLIRK
jgi:deoxyadenosine/deoxycytidine kinase